MSDVLEGKVAYACIHQEVRWRGQLTGYYIVVPHDGTPCFSRRRVKIVDAANRAVPDSVEITPDSEVRIRFRVDSRGIRWMAAVQIVRLIDDDQESFEPVESEGVFSVSG